jgi:hypothetical protein
MIAGCPRLFELLEARAKNKRKHAHEKTDESNIAFKMIRDDAGKVRFLE